MANAPTDKHSITISDLQKCVQGLAAFYNFTVVESSENLYRIFTNDHSGITLFLRLGSQQEVSYYFLERTYNYHGDRTDVHVIMSLMFAAFLRMNDHAISCALYDIPHPAIADEIWGRYIVPQQMNNYANAAQAMLFLLPLLDRWQNMLWGVLGCPCPECSKHDDIVEPGIQHEVDSSFFDIMTSINSSSTSTNTSSRVRPTWNYFYDMSREITVIRSKPLVKYIQSLETAFKSNKNTIQGINGTLVLDVEIRNFISYKVILEFNRIIEVISPKESLKLDRLIFMDNMVMVAVGDFLVALGSLGGQAEFKKEREAVRLRHNEESKLLFPISAFIWQEDICPDQFEQLIKSLLEREQGVLSVRRAGPLNQGDKGRDLIIEWEIVNKNAKANETPIASIKVVGQCKASAKTVGKSKVVDIRDTVETHCADGFFLAVSGQISTALTEKLEQLKRNGIWTQWWNRDDIELRLYKHQDLIPLYPKVLKEKGIVKFVETV